MTDRITVAQLTKLAVAEEQGVDVDAVREAGRALRAAFDAAPVRVQAGFLLTSLGCDVVSLFTRQ